jgi:hypothetical protein
METTENIQIEAVSESLLDQYHQARGTRSSYVTSNKNPSKKHPQNFPRKSQEKTLKITKKGKTGGTQPSLEEPRQIIYTYQRGSYKV